MATSVEQNRNDQSTRSVLLAVHAHHLDSSAPTYGKSGSENLRSWRDWWTPLISAVDSSDICIQISILAQAPCLL